VLTHDRLDELVPIEPAAMPDRQVIEWDKDDIDALKFMKVDCLALGMLTCMKRAFNFLAEAKGIELDLATIPSEDPRTYAMIRKADTLGTFQIESRAQMAMLPRMKPRTFYDLVIEVAIVRPGPIQGDMVHPYLRRREGKEPVVFPKPELEKVLGKTLGAGDAGRRRVRRLHTGRGRPATPRNGDVQVHRRCVEVQGQACRRHGRSWIRQGVRGEDVQPVGRVRKLRLSGKPRRLLRVDRLRLLLDQVLASGRVLRVAAQCPTDGLLRAGADRAMPATTASRSGRSASTVRGGTVRWNR
jgi:hypothetical protein